MVEAFTQGFVLPDSKAYELASTFGTPLYVVDELTFRLAIRAYLAAWSQITNLAELSFASKANSALALLAIAHQEGLFIDVASEGEFESALRAGVPASRCHFHGSNKSLAELQRAHTAGIGQVIVDNLNELECLGSLGPWPDTTFLIRIAPGVEPNTHRLISTGGVQSKFGFTIDLAEAAWKRAAELGVRLSGVHCHIGSQILDTESHRLSAKRLGEFCRSRLVEIVNFGGGLGIRYTASDNPPTPRELSEALLDGFRDGFGSPTEKIRFGQEPGRSLIGPAGVTLYRVGARKTSGETPFISIDGGISDNPRPALYGSKYSLIGVPNRGGPTSICTVSGSHCETDEMFPDVELPDALTSGDLIQVLATGAYNASMASNYNRFRRPAMVLLRENGEAQVIQERESLDQVLSRDILPKDIGVII